jgi:Skp family chaperone for outer membrane proteins
MARRSSTSEESKPKSTIYFTDLSRYLDNPTTIVGEARAEDELDKVMKEATRRKIQHLKMMELDRYLWETKKEALEARKEVEQLKKELEKLGVPLEGQQAAQPQQQEGEQAVSREYMDVARMLAELPDEKREAVINTYMLLRSADRMGPAASLMLPIMAAYMKSNPSAGQADLIKLSESMANQVKTLLEVARGQQPAQQVDQITSIATLIKTLADIYRPPTAQADPIDLLKKVLDFAGALTGQRSVWDEILEDENKYRRLKEILGGSSQLPPEVVIKLEEMRQAHEREMKKLDLEILKLRSELLESRRKSKQFAMALRKIGEAVASGLREAEEESRPYAYGQAQQQPLPQPQPQTLKCPKCGADVPNCVPGAKVTCPSCNSTYLVRSSG